MVLLKSIFKKNPQAPEDAPKLYASAVHSDKVDIEKLALAVSERCSLRRSDVQGALVALMDIIPSELLKGNIVSLGELGSFYANVKSEGVATEEEISVSMVKGTRIKYRPTKELTKKLRMIDFSFTG
jgi:predicted histone-like DNA-binding protein